MVPVFNAERGCAINKHKHLVVYRRHINHLYKGRTVCPPVSYLYIGKIQVFFLLIEKLSKDNVCLAYAVKGKADMYEERDGSMTSYLVHSETRKSHILKTLTVRQSKHIYRTYKTVTLLVFDK